MKRIMVLATVVGLAGGVRAANVTFNTGDEVGASSFTNGTNWSDGAAPSSAKDYAVALGTEKVLRAPISSASNETVTWPGGALTLGSASEDGKLIIPQYGTVTANDKWSTVSFGSLVLNRGVIARDDIAPTEAKHTGGIKGPATVNATAANPFVFENTNRAFYVSNAFTGGRDAAILFRRTTGNTLAAEYIRFCLTGNNSGYLGQFIFDNVETSWRSSLDSTVWGGNDAAFRPDAIVLKNGARMRTFREYSNNGQDAAILTMPDKRGITIINAATFQSHNQTEVYADITGDTLNLIGVADGASSRYFMFYQNLAVDDLVLSSSLPVRVLLMDGATIKSGTRVQVGSSTGSLNTYFGTRVDVTIQATVAGKSLLYASSKLDRTAYGVITLTEGSSLPTKLYLAVDAFPCAASATRLPVLKVPTSVRETLTADQIVLNTFKASNAGTARTDVSAEVETAGGYHTVYVRRAGTQSNYRYVVTPQSVSSGYVDDGAYQTWETAATNLAKAISAAAKGDVIYVAKGVYDVAQTIVLEKDVEVVGVDPETMFAEKGVILDGGYPARTNRIMKIKNAKIHFVTFRNGATTATGYYSGNAKGGGAVNMSGNAHRFYDCEFVGNHAVGCEGGAVASHGVYGQYFFTRCLFADNVADSNGGATQHQYDGAYHWVGYRDCLFTNNVASSTLSSGVNNANSATIHCSSRGIRLERCTLIGNHGPSAATLRCGRCVIKDCVFDGTGVTNGVAGWRGLYLDDTQNEIVNTVIRNYAGSCWLIGRTGSSTFENLVVTNNSVNMLLYFYTDGKANQHIRFRNAKLTDNTLTGSPFGSGYHFLDFENCTFSGNACADNQSLFGFAATYYSSNNIVNCILSGNTGKIPSLDNFTTASGNHSLIVSNSILQVSANGAYDANVYFDRKPGFCDAARGDYTLRRSAFARDRGIVLAWQTKESTDLAKNPRVVDRTGKANTENALPDLGCYEQQLPPAPFVFCVQ